MDSQRHKIVAANQRNVEKLTIRPQDWTDEKMVQSRIELETFCELDMLV